MMDRDVAAIGRLLGDPTRVALLDALFDGRAYTVSELARSTQVAVSTASEHLARLLDGGLVSVEAQGRHRYYRLANRDVAKLLETMFEFTAHQPSIASRRVPADLMYARSCYDHLAGSVAVALSNRLAAMDAVELHDAQPRLTEGGRLLFIAMGILPLVPKPGRPMLRHCLDWTERERWCARRNGRALRFTDAGYRQLRAHFGLDISSLSG
jgi:DNA-binding transcriptional ArsR family regulator